MMSKTLLDTYRNITHPLSTALSNAQRYGILIDIAARDGLKKKTEGKINATLRRISELAGKDINPNSPKQVAELLYRDLKFPILYNKQKRPTTDENAILTLHKKYPSEEVLSAIISYRKDTKLISTFLDVEVDSNNRMHTSYNASGTKNYRISSSKDLFGSGMNLQNIPVGKRPGIENIRNIFISPPGYSLVKCDLVQAETMVVARILCRYEDYTIWNKYTHDADFDIHRWAAAPICGVREEDVTKHQRDIGKLANHAGNYCAGPYVIQSQALLRGIDGVDYRLAKHIIDTRRKQIPGLSRWWQDVEATIISTRTLNTCIGRRRLFFGRFDDNSVMRDAVAFEPQSTVGDVCNMIFLRLHQRLKAPAVPILQVHDEVVVECLDEQVSYVADEMRKAAAIPLNLNDGKIEPLLIPLDVGVGKNWKDVVSV